MGLRTHLSEKGGNFGLAMMLLAGFTPMTVVGWATVAAYAALRRRGAAVVSFGLAVGLCAAQLAPTWELAQLSVARYRADWLGGGGGVPWSALATLVRPRLEQVDPATDITFQYLYCGLLAIPLGLLGARRAGWWALAVVVSAAAMAGVWQRALPTAISITYYPEYAAAPFTMALAVLAGFGANRLGRAAWPIAAATAIDLLANSSGLPTHAMPGPRDQLDPGTVAELRRLTSASTPPSRIDTRNGGLAWVQSAPITGIPTAGGYDPMALVSIMEVRRAFAKGERWGAFYEVEQLDSPVPGQLNVSHIVDGGAITAVANVVPRFWMEGGTVRVVRYGMREVLMESDSPQPARLESSEARYPGWTARIDGVPTAFDQGPFRAHSVPAGRHTVQWRFEPAVLHWSAAASGLSAILCMVVAWRRWSSRAGN